jgi:D-alanine-D-alanine ligase
MKKQLAVFFGGRSPEHDVSIISAVTTMCYLDRKQYDIFPIYMRGGNFYTGNLFDIEYFADFKSKKYTKLCLIGGTFYSKIKNVLVKKFKPDCALICCHGGEGESGILQGLLEYNGIPYSGCGVLESAFGMNKSIQKELLNGLMLNTVKHLTIDREDYKANCQKEITHLETFLDYPMIVKPNSLGSSIGIKLAENRVELCAAIDVAKQFDGKIIVETALTDFTEVNCAAFRRGSEVVVSEVERPLNWQSFLSFDDKYLGRCKGQCEFRELPAKLDEDCYAYIKTTTEKIFRELGLSGVVRVDYMIDNPTKKLYVNEINTIPGSLAFYLFEPQGIEPSEVLDAMIAEATQKNRLKQDNLCVYFSDVLKKTFGAKISKG